MNPRSALWPRTAKGTTWCPSAWHDFTAERIASRSAPSSTTQKRCTHPQPSDGCTGSTMPTGAYSPPPHSHPVPIPFPFWGQKPEFSTDFCPQKGPRRAPGVVDCKPSCANDGGMRWRVFACISLLAAVSAVPVARAATVPVLVIDGKGWGHGVGMAQDGAYWMGVGGANANQILGHFYPGTAIGHAS